MDHKAVMICMVSTASISFAASLCMFVIIGPCRRRKEQDGSISSSTYHRILLGISVSNVFQTLGLLLGHIVIPPPKDFLKEIWTFGPISICKASGFLHQLGQSCALMYYLFLCYLFRCKIIGKMSDHACSGDKERIVHALIIITGIFFCTTLVFLRSAKSIAVNGYYCDLGTVFPDCKNHPNLFRECDESYEKAAYLISLGLRVLSLACFAGIVMMFLHICFLHPAGVGALFPKERKEVAFCDHESEPKPKKGGDEELSHSVGENEDNSFIYRKRLVIQLCFYTLVFFVTYMFPTAVYVHATAWSQMPPSGFFAVGIITYSLSGFCILLVYIRPKVLSSIRSQEKKSCFSVLRIFVETIKSMKLIPIIIIEDQEKSQSERPYASDHDPSFQHSSPITRRVYYTFPIPTTPKLRGLVVVPGSEDDDDINSDGEAGAGSNLRRADTCPSSSGDGEGSNLRRANTCPSSSGKESFTMASIPEVNEEDEDDIEEC